MVEPAYDPMAVLAKLGTIPERVTSDSRAVGRGDAFAAWPGTRVDGRAFIPDAIARGAGAVLWDTRDFRWNDVWSVPNAGVEQLAARLGYIANIVYGNPSRDLWMVGVTGTNGKTTISQWIAQGLDGAGKRCGVIGTLGIGLVGALAPAINTTPDAAVFHETLARFRDDGAKAVAMEVSSIGLDQGRMVWARRSTSPCSPTSRATTSTTTARWPTTATRRRGCSRGPGSRARSSTPTIRTASA